MGRSASWDTRLWKGDIPQLTYVWSNALVGLVPGYIKPDAVAWYADHKRSRDGSNDPYAFTYFSITNLTCRMMPRSVRLPDDDRIKLMAATVG